MLPRHDARQQLMAVILQSKRVGQLAVALALAATVAGCSSVVDNIPTSMGGLPEGVPQRPVAPGAYPAVHETPPQRQDGVLSEAESKRLREELKNARNRIAPAEADGGTAGNAGSARNP
jgi:hypothetical protein